MKKFLKSFILAIFLFTIAQGASAASIDMKGYAWGADDTPFGGVGWINFNNTATGSNTSTGVDYKVQFNRTTKALEGYAWSERYGYIKFGGFTESGDNFPLAAACEGNTETDARCNAHLIQTSGGYQLVGYARFCFVYQNGCSGSLRPAYELGGYDGWIGFKGASFSVTYATSNNRFEGFAWGGGGSSPSSPSSYGQGTGWISVNPNGNATGVSCVIDTNFASSDCLSDNDKPIVTLTPSKSVVDYNEQISMAWSISNAPHGCTVSATSSNTGDAWHGNSSITAPTGNTPTSGTVTNITVTNGTTFNLGCSYGGETGTDTEIVTVTTYTPVVTWVNVPATANYNSTVTLTYNVTNIPNGCTGRLYGNGSQVGSTISVGTGNRTYTTPPLTQTTNWEFTCTDPTPPDPNTRVGYSTQQTTTMILPNPVINLTAKDHDTNSTTIIPCINHGVDITYTIVSGAATGSCKALINGSNTDAGWGSGITINQNGSQQSLTTIPVTQTGTLVYQIQCMKADGTTPYTIGKQLTRSCDTTPGTLSVTAAKACYEIGVDLHADILYKGSNLQANSCTKSLNWNDSMWTGNLSNFDNSSSFSPALLGVGTYNYTMSNCKEENYPSNPALSPQTGTFQVKASGDHCVVSCTDSCNPACSNYKSSLRCALKGPKFKEQ